MQQDMCYIKEALREHIHNKNLYIIHFPFLLFFPYFFHLKKKKDMLQCKICKKEFSEFDQRGFRNAGFTAHQNRCIERQNRERNPEQFTSKLRRKRRLLLPASLNLTRSGTSPPDLSIIHPLSVSSSFIDCNIQSQPSASSLLSFQSAVTTAPILASASAAYASIPVERSMNYQQSYDTSISCNYCNLDNGSHAFTCTFFCSK